MSTPKIKWQNGAIYHVGTRGNHKEKLFNDLEDFNVYLGKLEESLIYYKELNYTVVAYCLMSNHVHLLIKTDKAPLTSLMRRLNSTYALYYNLKYKCVGHLFEGRYFYEMITDYGHLLELSRYIHLNPVRANIVDHPKKYKWSSYTMFVGNRKLNIINPEIVLDRFVSKKRYKEFVENAIISNKKIPII
ncbi:transposase [Clostridium sp. AL.422]|uniref:transposase n=1 Tax=Clostridium TaxID=1485 RepID=UPI00293DA416|nr:MULTISPECIES: transposase [unclassified Clostridium]MDV4150414.1 transposase [Clostridium sp. AL.422]